jgi:diguanylate cyclase (GGDEF)-like protein
MPSIAVHAPTSEAPAPHADGAREARRVAQRVAMLRMVLLSYWIDAGLLWLFWRAGAFAIDAAVISALGGTAACGVFHVAYRRGWGSRWGDRNFTLPQVLAATGVQLLVAWRVPQATLPALTVLFIVFSVAALRLSARAILAAWVGISAGLVWVVAASPAPLAFPHATPAQALLSGQWLALVIGRCAGVGLYGSSVRRQLSQRTRELAAATGQLELLASRDGLTGALNRRAIVQTLTDALGRLGHGQHAAVLLVDMDHFKAVNDRHGHAVGDEVLRRFVVAAASTLRASDRLGRYGGEEFLLVLPSVTGADSALSIAQRLCETIAAQDWHPVAAGLNITVSVGVTLARCGEPAEAVVARADQALYRTKDEGRNGVRLAWPDPGPEALGVK